MVFRESHVYVSFLYKICGSLNRFVIRTDDREIKSKGFVIRTDDREIKSKGTGDW